MYIRNQIIKISKTVIMKSVIYNFFVLFAFFTMYNCTDDSNLTVERSERVSIEKILSVLNMPDESSRKLAYSLLNGQERMKIWKDKFEILINESKLFGIKVQLTEGEISLVQEINSKLELHLFEHTQSDEKEIFKNVYIPEFINRAEEVFENKYLLGMIFYENTVILNKKIKRNIENADISDLIDSFNGRNEGVIGEISDKKDCDCSVGSFFSCAWGQHDDHCKKSECEETNGGCGFLLLSDCDSICKFI